MESVDVGVGSQDDFLVTQAFEVIFNIQAAHEMYNLMRSLDIEDNLEGLRYEKVVLATDADVDGLHIRNLLITYFFRFFDQLVHDGHLFVLETPLFRVRNKEKTIYSYSEGERDDAAKT